MFRVAWLQTALNELAALWLKADTALRKSVTTVTHQVDLALKTAPLEQGESRANGRRLMFAFPLAILFEVLSESSTVRVLHVRLIKPKKKGP